jgi:LacI family transcriptional regulator
MEQSSFQVFSQNETRAEYARVLKERRLPLVLLVPYFGSIDVDFVTPNRERAFSLVTRHLISRGHRRIAFAGVPDMSSRWENDKRNGYASTMEEAGLEPRVLQLDSRTLQTTHGHYARSALALGYAEGLEIAQTLRGVTAIVCNGDLKALGIMRGLRERGVRVPEDIAVTGYGDLPEGEYAAPPLTSVAVPYELIAQEAVRILLDRAEEPTVPLRQLYVDVKLVVRQSSDPQGGT